MILVVPTKLRCLLVVNSRHLTLEMPAAAAWVARMEKLLCQPAPAHQPHKQGSIILPSCGISKKRSGKLKLFFMHF